MISTTHVVILPSYNSGPRLGDVVREVLRQWQPVIVVIDGSTDGSDRAVDALAEDEPALTVIKLAANYGKGAAVLAGAAIAREHGHTHALVMDADGQHPADHINAFMQIAEENPTSLVLGKPIFPANVPAARLHGRKVSIALVRAEILGGDIADPLYGFRVYPIQPLLSALRDGRRGRRYDFDTEAAVRLVWAGLSTINVPAPVRYFDATAGGISHFRYGRDNLRLMWMHTRLMTELLLWRWPAILARRLRRRSVERTAALAADSKR